MRKVKFSEQDMMCCLHGLSRDNFVTGEAGAGRSDKRRSLVDITQKGSDERSSREKQSLV